MQLLIIALMTISAFAQEKKTMTTEDCKSKPESYWKEKLTPAQYKILREKGTERAFTGKYHDHHEKGIYKCAACGLELFASEKNSILALDGQASGTRLVRKTLNSTQTEASL